jgi:ribosomal protein S18 acetylase RimI-like enzyme
MSEIIRILAINSNNVFDRLKLCWGHLEDWQNSEIVQKSKEWLEKTNMLFTPTTFIAYMKEKPVGMIEFVPQKLMKKVGLCPCRANPEKGEVESRYVLGKEFDDCLFIFCLWVDIDHQGKGVGKTLLKYFLNSPVFKNYEGALVYVTERDEKWGKHIHWPAGPKEFYLKFGFMTEKTLNNPLGYLLHYRKTVGIES